MLLGVSGRVVWQTAASELWGRGWVHCTPEVKHAAYVKILSKPLTTRLYKAGTNLYPPPLMKSFRRV